MEGIEELFSDEYKEVKKLHDQMESLDPSDSLLLPDEESLNKQQQQQQEDEEDENEDIMNNNNNIINQQDDQKSDNDDQRQESNSNGNGNGTCSQSDLDQASLYYSSEYGIRDSVRSQVEDVQWYHEVKQQLYIEEQRKLSQKDVIHDDGSDVRCAVCTLPIGTCVHTTTWMDKNLVNKENSVADDHLQNELEQVLGLLDNSGAVELTTRHQHGDIDLNTIRWAQHTPRFADKIGKTC